VAKKSYCNSAAYSVNMFTILQGIQKSRDRSAAFSEKKEY